MDIHQVFNDSFDRCNRNEAFLKKFYARFFLKDQKFKEMFEGVDMAKQMTMIKASMIIIMLAPTSASARQTVRGYAKRHGKDGIGITTDDLKIWFECLLKTIEECDPRFSDQVARAWQEAFADGLAIMQTECEV
ncbi:hypothetical protein A3K86_15175 [Photobacterium jeanii]|uniref:Globin domain-containing protein n=1 Tax=Photobacterium jeanii TaxID=858640 RepID=A0A178K6P2_9GAMM|nr:globin [Photobacterium jeanii]OAN13008.1 hypothetical protein A3K86_15175 [Photobacterium jeanii]PST89156.1 globin [Photobacterium jeanii]